MIIRRRPAAAGACVLVILLLLGNMLSLQQKIPQFLEKTGLEEELESGGPRRTRVQARILSHESRSGREYLCCRILCIESSDLKALRHLSGQKHISGMILIQTTSQYTSKTPLLCGYDILAEGDAALSERAANPGEMDFYEYDQKKGILFRLVNAEVEAVNRRSTPAGVLDLLSRALRLSLKRVLPADDAGMLSGILLGRKEEMSADLKNLYQEGGIAHILAISSLHIQLLAMGSWRFLRRRGFSFAGCAVTSGTLITLFCLMSGMSVSSRRALILFLIWSLAQVLGRSTDLITSLSLALSAALLGNAGALWDSGLWLSYGCVLSICLLEKPLHLIVPLPGKVGEALLCGLAIWLGTVPVVMYSFYRTAPWSVLVNLVVIPLLGVLMTVGFLASLTGMIWTAGGRFLGGPCHYILLLFRNLCLLERKLPWGIWVCGRPGLWQISMYYLLLGSVLGLCAHLKRKRKAGEREKKRKQVFLTCFLFLAGTAAGMFLLTWRPTHGLEIVFEDVGQGDGILIHKDGFCALVDCGSSSSDGVWTYRMEKTLAYNGISKLDCIFLTHGDQDHISGVTELLDHYENGLLWGESGGIRVGTIFMSAAAQKDEALVKLAGTCDSLGVEHRMFGAGSVIDSGKMKIRCLYPGGEEGSNENENSMVLLVTYGQVSFLLTGDIGFEAEEMLLKQEGDTALPADISVLKTAHHGSRFSTSEAFLDRVHPALSVISCSEDNPFGHPSEEALERLAKAGSRVLCTKDAGAVIVRTDGSRIRYFSFTEKKA